VLGRTRTLPRCLARASCASPRTRRWLLASPCPCSLGRMQYDCISIQTACVSERRRCTRLSLRWRAWGTVRGPSRYSPSAPRLRPCIVLFFLISCTHCRVSANDKPASVKVLCGRADRSRRALRRQRRAGAHGGRGRQRGADGREACCSQRSARPRSARAQGGRIGRKGTPPHGRERQNRTASRSPRGT